MAIGVNFTDVYYRTGLYKSPFPVAMGMEGAGIVAAIGPEVNEVAVGNRVAWAGPRGSYAECALVPADKLIKIPDPVDFKTAAAVMQRG